MELIRGEQIEIDGITLILNSAGEIQIGDVEITLQEATDNGNTTDTDIELIEGAKLLLSNNSDSLGFSIVYFDNQVTGNFIQWETGANFIANALDKLTFKAHEGSGNALTCDLTDETWRVVGAGSDGIEMQGVTEYSGSSEAGFAFDDTGSLFTGYLIVNPDISTTKNWEFPDESGVLQVNEVLYSPISSTDAAAPNSTLYYSTDQSKLVWKDSGGTVNDLY